MRLKIEGTEVGMARDFALTFNLENAFFDEDLTVKHSKYSYPAEIPLSASLRKQLLHKNRYKNNSILPSTLNARLEDGVFGKNYTFNVLKAEEYYLRGSVSESSDSLFESIGAKTSLREALNGWEYTLVKEQNYIGDVLRAYFGRWINEATDAPATCFPVRSKVDDEEVLYNQPRIMVWSEIIDIAEMVYTPDTFKPFLKISILLQKLIEACGYTLENNIFALGNLADLHYVVPILTSETYLLKETTTTVTLRCEYCVPEDVTISDFIDGLKQLFNFRIKVDKTLGTATIVQPIYGTAKPLNVKRSSIKKSIIEQSGFNYKLLKSEEYGAESGVSELFGNYNDGDDEIESFFGSMWGIREETISQITFPDISSNALSYSQTYNSQVAYVSGETKCIPLLAFVEPQSFLDEQPYYPTTHNYYTPSQTSEDGTIRLVFNEDNGLFKNYHEAWSLIYKNQNLLELSGYLAKHEALQLDTLSAYEYEGIRVVIKSGSVKIPVTGKAYVDLVLARI